MLSFRYDSQILADFPDIVGGVLRLRGIQNQPSPPALLEAYNAEQASVRERLADTPLSSLETISAWRAAFRRFDVDPTQYRNAAEALLRRLTKKGDIPSINALVDIGNLISIRYALPVCVVDERAVTGHLTVRRADGSEHYTELDSDELKHPNQGEVIYADDAGVVHARRWCWRQSAPSAVQPDTTHALIAIEAQHPNSKAMIQQAQGELAELISAHLGGDVMLTLLDRRHSST